MTDASFLFFTVLKGGGPYAVEHLRILCDGLMKCGGVPQVVVLTDQIEAVLEGCPDVVPLALQTEAPGWWAKVDLLQYNGPLVYLDLDTVVVGDLGPLMDYVQEMDPGTLLMLRDFYRAAKCNSGLLAWNGSLERLYRVAQKETGRAGFRKLRNGWGARIGGRWHTGDGPYLEHLARRHGVSIVAAQDVVDGVLSYKVHVKDHGLPTGARLVCFHGNPRPWEVDEPWMTFDIENTP